MQRLLIGIGLFAIVGFALKIFFADSVPTDVTLAEPSAEFVAFTGMRSGFPEPPFHWCEGDEDGTGGATKDFYNRSARLAWRHSLGDWDDREGVAQGEIPFAIAEVIDDDRPKFIEWDVTDLVRDWNSGVPNKGFFLRTRDRCNLRFDSRESASSELTPQLVLKTAAGPIVVQAAADTHLNYATSFSLGKSPELSLTERIPILIRFSIDALNGAKLDSAILRIHTNSQYGSGKIGVYRCSQGDDLPSDSPEKGVASNYPLDVGISEDASVLFATGFDSSNWKDEWTKHLRSNRLSLTSNDAELKFSKLVSKALKVEIRKGDLGALNSHFYFAQEGIEEPEEIFFRYYLRLGNDWNQTSQNGKLPGVAGTYGKSGWGGRRSDGSDGWSARGLFMQTIPKGNPLAGRTPIGTYCYHANMESPFGDSWVWSRNFLGYLARNHWYCIEHHLRLNTPGEKNGLLEGWVDGQLAFQKNDIRFRNTETVKIEDIWMDVYHGGTEPSPHDQHLFIDNVVIARDYIGPIGTR